MRQATIIYTLTDEAPALASYSLLPIVDAFATRAGLEVETRDISLAARILTSFPDFLDENQRIPDSLAELGEIAKTPEANIIKLPNISASVPQLTAAIEELQQQGFRVPDFPEDPRTPGENAIRERYARVLGSAVNPVLREGNSDRRVAAPVKAYARAHPHSMGEWSPDSRSHVAHMNDGDFYSSEQSQPVAGDGKVRIVFEDEQGQSRDLRDPVPVTAGEIIDAAVMNVSALRSYFAEQMEAAREQDLLLSLHLKATMMKVSDPIMFGHAVRVFYEPVFAKHQAVFENLGVDANNGIGDVYGKIAELDEGLRHEIVSDIEAVYRSRPRLAMVDSDRGITNLHVPNNVIIDASMPAALRSSGKMWGPDGTLDDTKALIPDRSYARIYQQVFDFCRTNGAFDPATMGNVSNVGLMAQKAEEYGSHDKTFEIESAGTVRVLGSEGQVLMEHAVQAGDIYRMCQTRDLPVRDWVRLAVHRARVTGNTTLFWLDPDRAHDARLIEKVKQYLPEHDTQGLDIRVLSPVDAMRETLEGVGQGKDFVSVTGNVLRDYLTDLFPILELGTSAKMMSIVPLLNGGGLYETGAGGSAPKHVQQFVAENHLRWDSLGEFLALQVSLADLADKTANNGARILAQALDRANAEYLNQNRSPSRKTGELDNRGSHFYLALYWARALSDQDDDPALQMAFRGLADALEAAAAEIVAELESVQGVPVDIGGYYWPDPVKLAAAMRPCDRLNALIDEFGSA